MTQHGGEKKQVSKETVKTWRFSQELEDLTVNAGHLAESAYRFLDAGTKLVDAVTAYVKKKTDILVMSGVRDGALFTRDNERKEVLQRLMKIETRFATLERQGAFRDDRSKPQPNNRRNSPVSARGPANTTDHPQHAQQRIGETVVVLAKEGAQRKEPDTEERFSNTSLKDQVAKMGAVVAER